MLFRSLMLPHAIGNANAVARFMHEAQAVARLRSEHVCRVFDIGTRAGAPFIVMEMLAGQDLAQVLEHNGSLPVGDVVDCVMQVLDALADAHGRGIVHRDLKPSNVFVTTAADGSALVKLLDFGVSKSSSGATRTGEMMGTPAYMAPEQMQSTRSVDARADLWAMGVIAYEALTGQNPFVAETLPGMCIRVMTHEPAPLQGPFGAVVMRCLAKVPEARYANVAELAEALAPFGSPAASQLARKIVRASGVRMAMPVSNPTPALAMPTTLQGAAGALASRVVSPRAKAFLPAVALGAGLAVAIGALIPRHTASAQTAPPAAAVATMQTAAMAPAAAVMPKPSAPAPASASVAVPADHSASIAPTTREPQARPVRVEIATASPPPAQVTTRRVAPSSAVAAASLMNPSLPDTLTRELIEPSMLTVRPLTMECARDLETHGVVTVHVRVDRSGATSSVTTDSEHPELARCVAAAVRQLVFAATNTGGTFQRTFVL